ncbi:hypothetical protein GCM10018965_050310 [Nonomuraea roseola]
MDRFLAFAGRRSAGLRLHRDRHSRRAAPVHLGGHRACHQARSRAGRHLSPDRRGKILELLAGQPWRAWKGTELAAILGIDNINSFRVRLSQWSHQGYIYKIGPALHGTIPTST